METKEVDLGGGITATLRCPDMLIWSEWEALVLDEAPKTREDKIVDAYLAREQGRDAPPAPPPTETRKVKLSPRAGKFLQTELLRDCLVSVKVKDMVYEMMSSQAETLSDGEVVFRLKPIEPPPYDLRDLRPWRCARLVNGLSDLVYGAPEVSFREAGEARPGEENPSPIEGDGAEPAPIPEDAGVGSDR